MPTLSKYSLAAALSLAVAALAGPARAADLDKLAPADAEAVVFLNVRSLTDSVIFQKYLENDLERTLDGEQAAQFFKQAEFDPLKDLTSVTVTAAGGSKGPRFCVILRGKFNPRAQAERTSFTIPNLLGQEFTGTFATGDALVLSNNKDYLKDIVAGKKSEPTEDAKTLAKAVGRFSGQETAFLAVTITKDKTFVKELKDQVGRTFIALAITQNLKEAKNQFFENFAAKLESQTAALTLTEALDLTDSVHTTDEAAAKQLVQTARGFVQFARLPMAGNEEFKPIVDAWVDSVKITADGTTATARLQLSREAVDRLMKSLNLPAEPRVEVPLTARQVVRKGQAALKAGDWAEAEREFKRALDLDPKHATAADGLAQAAEGMRKAGPAHLAAGQAALAAKRWADAEWEFSKSLKGDPGNTAAAMGLQTARTRQHEENVAKVPGFIRQLQSPDRLVRRRAAEALGALGPDAREAISALTKALKDDDLEVQAEARIALKKVHP